MTETLQDLFQISGFQVVTASNGLEGLQASEREQVDIVVSDLRMPVMDGVELLKNFKAKAPETPFILMSGFSDYRRDQVLALGAYDLLPKPVDLDELLVLSSAHSKTQPPSKSNKSLKTMFLWLIMNI